MTKALLPAVLLLAALIVPAAGAQSIEPIGFLPGGAPPSLVADLSGDGEVIVGSATDAQPTSTGFIWKNGVMAILGAPPTRYSTATAVSGDGSIAVGITNAPFQLNAPARWRDGAVEELSLPGGEFPQGQAHGISGDGNTIVGWSVWYVGNVGFGGATRWVSGVHSVLPKLAGDTGSKAVDASGDGSVIVGASELAGPSGTQSKAVRWTEDGTVVENLHPPGWDQSFATAVSADGSVVVGWVDRAPTGVSRRPFVWRNGVATVFDMIPGGTYGEATDVSGDGSVIVGSGLGKPIIWDADNGWRRLDSLLTDLGIDLAEWTSLSTVVGVSDDGRVVAGSGIRNAVSEGYRAELAAGPPLTYEVAVSDTDSYEAFDANDRPTVSIGDEVFLLIRVINSGAEELSNIVVANLEIFPDTVEALNFLRADPLSVDNLAPDDTSRIVFVYEALADVDITISVLAMQATIASGPDIGQTITAENTTCSIAGKRGAGPQNAAGTSGSGCGKVSVEPTSLVVNSTSNRNDTTPGDGACDTGEVVTIDAEDHPECTLRAAIQEAAGSTSGDALLVKFDIPGGDPVHRIELAGPFLPAVTSSIIIKGASQPDGALIEVDGSGYEGTATSVAFNLGNGSSGIADVTDIAFYGFPTGVLGMRAGANGVYRNRFGTDWAGTHETGSAPEIAALRNGGNAVLVTGQGASIGNDPLGGGGNLIVGSLNGIYVDGAPNVTIGNNTIGSVTSPNSENGILLDNARDAVVGSTAGSNTITQNRGHGILVQGTVTAPLTIQDNTIEKSGMDGINVQQDPNPELRQTIGGTRPQGNAIRDNTGAGIRVLGDADATQDPVERMRIQSNVLEGNGGKGVVLVNGSRVRIGGFANELGVEPGNLIMNGVSFEPGYASWIEGNVISNIDPVTGISAAEDAVYIRGNLNTVGGDSPEKGNHIKGIPDPDTGPLGLGVDNEGIDTIIQENLIGTDGTVATPLETGILLVNPATVRRNIISGNSYAGISTQVNATIVDNYIGVDVTGLVAIPNQGPGVEINGGAITLGEVKEGDSCEDVCNVISGNKGPGILVTKDGTGSTIIGNIVGMSADQHSAVGNEGGGIVVLADQVTIGGPSGAAGPTNKCDKACNLIAGNVGDGIRSFEEETFISVVSPGGVPSAGEDGAAEITVQGNIIGVAIPGADGYLGGNAGNGVALGGGGDDHKIGGFGVDEGNLITWNQGSGVIIHGSSDEDLLGGFVNGGKRNAIHANSFVQNRRIAIDLGTDHLLASAEGWNILDAGDDDEGVNNLINWPYLIESRGNATFSDLLVLWTGASGLHTLSVYTSATCRGGSMDASIFHTTRSITFVGGAADTVRVANLRASDNQPLYTATVTDSEGNTSEFSNCRHFGRRAKQVVANVDPDIATTVNDILLTLRQNDGKVLSKGATTAAAAINLFVLQTDEPEFGAAFEDSTAQAPDGSFVSPLSTTGAAWEMVALNTYSELRYDVCLPNASLGVDAERAVVVASGPATAGAWRGFDTRTETIDAVSYSCADGVDFLGTLALATSDAPGLMAAVLIAPADSSVGVSPTPTLSWAPSTQAQSYDVQIALGSDPSFSSPVREFTGLTAPVVAVDLLDRLTTFLWRARVVGATEAGPWSAFFSFSTGTSVDIVEVGDGGEAPAVLALSAAYPNPFSQATTLELDVARADHYSVSVYDALGRRVQALHEGQLNIGWHRILFEARDLPSGVYFAVVRSNAGAFTTRAVTLVR